MRGNEKVLKRLAAGEGILGKMVEKREKIKEKGYKEGR